MSQDRKILYGVSSGFIFNIVSITVALVQFRLILSYLPKEIAGIWFLFITFGTYIAFFDLGISPTLSREISFILGSRDLDNNQKTKEIADLVATCRKIFRFFALAIFMCALLLGGYVLDQSPTEIGTAWVLFSFGAALNLSTGAAFAVLYGLGSVATEKLIRSFTMGIGLVMSAASLIAGFGILGLAGAWVLQGMLARAFAHHFLYREYPEMKKAVGNARSEIVKKIAVPSLKWAVIGFGAILILQTDNVIIAFMMGTSAIPSYEAIAKIAAALMSFSLLIVTSSSPFISKAYAENKLNVIQELLSRNVRLSLSLILIFASFMAVFGDKVVNLWLGSGHFVGFPILWTFLVMAVLEVHHVALATATMATGYIAFVWPALIAGLLNIAISLILAQHLGLLGVALGTMIAQILTNNWYVPYVALKHFKIPVWFYIKHTIFPMAILFILCLAFNLFLKFTLMT